jgi:hypothetical protein
VIKMVQEAFDLATFLEEHEKELLI